MKNQKNAFLFIIVTVFLSIMGIGFIIPVIPFLVATYVGASNQGTIALVVGLLISTYAVFQFFAAPVWGALSDRYGRRPILLLCLFGSAIGYILFGVGGALWVLFVGRVIDGATGGDIGTLFAYVADITEPQDRGRKFGILGATVGVGFILGPTLGGLASNISLSAPFFIAAGITFVNMLFGYFVLPESLDKKHRSTDFSLHHLNPFVQLAFALRKPKLKKLLVVGFFYSLPFAQLQGINSVFLKDVLHFTPSGVGFLFLILGIFDIITQGYLSGKLMPRLGEKKLIAMGFILTGFSFLVNSFLPFHPITPVIWVTIIIYAIGSGFFEPAFGALVSLTAEPHEQGKVQGANQSAGSLSRIIGPLTAAGLYQISWGLPYGLSAILCFTGFLLVLFYL